MIRKLRPKVEWERKQAILAVLLRRQKNMKHLMEQNSLSVKKKQGRMPKHIGVAREDPIL